MLEKNKKIILTGEDALEALANIEFIMISLHKMGSYYSDKPVEKYRKATTEFIDNENVTQRLAKIRTIISKNFDSTLGEDDMDDIERHVEGIEFWKP
ncbi:MULTISPECIES: hypothetical protein [Pseudomonas]|uniref:hypothetical protein n=1 Tax=Pseudomonas TaxID=286 RepID=UPI000F053738|nr:hypothetical protein [Pseudomonas atacamensis]MCI9877754.1 hypothetical protein [Pseudomonas atacamensis]UVM00660.1 hypothetical protein LOY41_04950 [Pseudomonas atacamensis]